MKRLHQQGGGVETETDAEVVAVQVHGKHYILVIINAYRPTNNDLEQQIFIAAISNTYPKDCTCM